jgi:hypothetical protein
MTRNQFWAVICCIQFFGFGIRGDLETSDTFKMLLTLMCVLNGIGFIYLVTKVDKEFYQ